jgi:selenocysteine-specific elongation factor
MFVIGTAGHVDHGKSTLVQALTGIDPDRLAEEKARALTIDLGFAWLTLGKEEVGVVDVPGHRDFIENMLAGVGGIDLALFVVAADEGVMPQTEEHLAILDLLEVRSGVVALTKVDLIEDPDWLELVTLDLSETLAGTVLADAPIVPVSAHSGQGLEELKRVIQAQLAGVEARPDLGRPRLPVDRVFTLSGFGTVVTGTLLDGRFHTGDAIEIQPAGINGRIRGLQTHKTKRETVQPGSRVAVNLTGIDKDEVKRGDVIAKPGVVGGTILLDVAYRHLAGADKPLKHNVEVKLFTGAAEVVARTRVIGSKQIEPGANGWLQLALAEPVAVVRGDRFILRRPSPPATLGGGRVLDPHPGRRHRRFRPEVVERLQTLAEGSPAELVLQTIRRREPTTEKKLLKEVGLDRETAVSALNQLAADGTIFNHNGHILTAGRQADLLDEAERLVGRFHAAHPLRLGLSREELRSRLNVTPPLFNALMATAVQANRLVEKGALVSRPGHEVVFSEAQKTAVAQLLDRFAQSGIESPSVKECQAAVGEEVFTALIELGHLHQLNADVVYAPADYEQIVAQVTDYLREKGTIDAAQTRDLLQTSRKYAIAILEHLDEQRITKRVGDERVLVRP